MTTMMTTNDDGDDDDDDDTDDNDDDDDDDDDNDTSDVRKKFCGLMQNFEVLTTGFRDMGSQTWSLARQVSYIERSRKFDLL